MSQYIRIVYPKGDRTKLALAIAWDYEEDDYSLASRRRFDVDTEQDVAWEYAQELADKHGLEIVDSRHLHKFLD